MPEPLETRVAVLEEQMKNVLGQAKTLFDKIDKLTDKIGSLTDALRAVETEHETCIRMRTQTSGWLQGRATKVFDAMLGAGLIFMLILLLKNSATFLQMIGGAK
jgi:hypothetical protein